MGMSYKKLWKLLIDRDMIKKDLREGSGLSTASMAKLYRNKNVNTDVLQWTIAHTRIIRTVHIGVNVIILNNMGIG